MTEKEFNARKYEELEPKANKCYAEADQEYLSYLDESELFVHGYIAGAIEAEKTWEQERGLMQRRIDKCKEDLKKLRVAFIQLQVEALSGASLSDWIGRLAEELKAEGEDDGTLSKVKGSERK